MASVSDIDPKNPNKICGIDWGAIPTPKTYDDLYRNFGDPHSPSFYDKYLITIPHQIANGSVVHVTSHICMVTALHDLFATCKADIHSYDGCYVFRNVRGGTKLSMHSWGIAIDVNAAENPLGSTNRTKQPTSIINCLVNRHGFFWGANYHTRKDPMHFERAVDL